MVRKSFSIGLPLISIILFLTSSTFASAAPMPPKPVVNHQIRQCAIIVTGDECGDVILPDGWEYLDESAGETCPDGYATIELYPDWTHFKAQHCCTAGHSGTSGDCRDVVTNQSTRQCAFVEDIQNCPGLPAGWEAWGKNCPKKFEWVDDVICTSDQTNATPVFTPPSQIEPTPTSLESEDTGGGMIGTLEPTETTSKSDRAFPCPSLAMVLVGLVGAGFWSKSLKKY